MAYPSAYAARGYGSVEEVAPGALGVRQRSYRYAFARRSPWPWGAVARASESVKN